MRNRAPFQRHTVNLVVSLYALFCLFQLLNPRLPNWMVGVYGFESYLFYIPLMYMVPELLPDQKSFRRFVVALIVVSAPALLLGAVQFYLPADHVLNRYVWSDQSIATFGANMDHARVTSTFSYITGYAAFLTGLGVILLGLALLEERKFVRLALYATLLFTITDLLMTGSRAPVAQFLVAAPFVVLLTMGSSTKRHVKGALVVAAVLAVLAYAAVTFFPDAQQAFVDRVVENDSENVSRVTAIWTGTARALSQAGMAGYGIGSTLPGSSFLYDPLNTPDPPPWVEAELEHVIVETGFVGFLLTIAVRLLVPFELYRSLRLFPRSAARPLVAAALLFVLINLPMQIIVSRTAGIMYWFMAGVAFLPGSWAMMAAQEQVARLRQTSTLPAVSAARSV
jgi:hypothetical protein